MNVITITREYGAGGGELARRLAESLGWELLDRELLHQAADSERVPDAELERLDEKAISMADRFSLHPPHRHYLHSVKTAAEQAAQRGNVILVGRGARHLLGERAAALHLRLVAPKAWRAADGGPGRVVAAAGPGPLHRDGPQPGPLHPLFLRRQSGLPGPVRPGGQHRHGSAGRRRGGGGSGGTWEFSGDDRRFRRPPRSPCRASWGPASRASPPLATRLAMRVCDRDLLEQEAVRLGIPQGELEKIDERPAGIFQRFRPGSIYQRYFEVLAQLMHELAGQGDVILVGRGGSRLLRDDPRAMHVRLVAAMDVRVRRVMEYRWVRESIAKKLVAESDAQRRSFYESYFGADWCSPLEYHITANSGRLGPAAVDLLALAAERHWSHPQ